MIPIFKSKQRRSAGIAKLGENDCENRPSRNLQSLAVALNSDGISSLNGDVKAFDRLQIVLDRNSSYFEVQIMHGPGKVFRSFQFSFDERLVDNHLCGNVGQVTTLPNLYMLAHRLDSTTKEQSQCAWFVSVEARGWVSMQHGPSGNAEVNAFERLQIVRGRNSSYFGSK